MEHTLHPSLPLFHFSACLVKINKGPSCIRERDVMNIIFCEYRLEKVVTSNELNNIKLEKTQGLEENNLLF
jgi:hypothetical protein